MSSLFYLTFDNFIIKTINNNKVLCNNLNNFSLILFYSENCKFCKDLIRIFPKLSKEYTFIPTKCTFGMVNFSNSKNKKLYYMSKDTYNPINEVPTIIFYVNGLPYDYCDIEDNNEWSLQFISNYLTKLINNYNESAAKQQQMNKHEQQQEQPQSPFVGKSLKGNKHRKNVCYLKYSLDINKN